METEKGNTAYDHIPYIITQNDKVIFINSCLLNQTKYTIDNLMCKTLDEAFKLLNIKSEIKSISNGTRICSIITESLDLIELSIHEYNCEGSKDRINTFYLLKQYDKIHNIIENLDIPMAMLSYPSLDIIKSNKIMVSFINNIIQQKLSMDFSLYNRLNIIDILKLEGYMEKIADIKNNKSIVYIDNLELNLKDKLCNLNIIFQPLETNGEIKDLIMIIYDVTSEISQSKKLEDTLKTQCEFFSFISHEFKTPLSVINAAIQVLQLLYKDKLPEGAIEYINKIHKSTLQQIKLVNNLLDITKADLGYLKLHKKNVDIVNLTNIITESTSLYAKIKEIKLNFSSSLMSNIVAIDEEKYERILLNLLSNAIKFTPEGKSIYVKLFEENNRICLQIKDEGLGIPKDKLNTIFDRFVQIDNVLLRNSEGAGIGLYLVYQLVHAMNGEIFVDSNLDIGSTFTIYLPKELANESINHLQVVDNRLLQAVNIEFSNV